MLGSYSELKNDLLHVCELHIGANYDLTVHIGANYDLTV